MKTWIKYQLLGGALLVSGFVWASVQSDNYESVKAKVETTLGMQVSAIADSPVSGLLQLETDKGLFYASPDGKYLLQARVYNLDAGMRNETEEALTSIRREGVKEFKDSSIEFKAAKEKYVVNVFTDITCGYCRKLHNEMAQYNDLGITVRYLAYPREGLQGATYKNMVSVWCADNKQQAMTMAKNGQAAETKSCANDVAEQYAFGQKIGVNGTPNIIMPDVSVIPGYQPAKLLAQALKEAE
jgi:thiol:disulfide interchange protein DsbC